MINLIKTAYKTDTQNGSIYEIWTFANKVQKMYYSETLHKINFIASLYDKNIEIYKDFIFCENKHLNRINK